MELERPRRAAACTTSDILVCFSSGLPKSSAMKVCSKSSVSAMFPTARVNKKKGSDTENPEPCSPKVTCIGQVRVKTKKHGKKMKMNMRAYRARRSQGLGHQSMHQKQRREGEGCLHLQLQDRKQRWVHLPLTICDALRAFGSELNCFSHCIRSCFSKSKENCRRSSCGGFVCRWRVALHQEQLVVGEQIKEEEEEHNDRRSIFDDLDFSNEESNNLNENENENEHGGEEDAAAARSSICIPPKNALLLMRCRSDPLKMSALANKFWESPPKSKEDCIENVEDKPAEVVTARTIRRSSSCSCSRVRHELIIAMDEEQQRLQEKEEEVLQGSELQLQVNYEEPKHVEGELSFNDNEEDEVKDLDEEATTPLDPAQPSANEQSEQDIQPKVLEESHELEQTSSEQQPLEKSREEEDESVLPECLLLMMCEPKLSMEVSKETWICSTDFIRWLPERHRQHHLKKINPNPNPNPTNGGDEANNKNNKTAGNPPPPLPPARIPAQKQNQSFQPPRSSCSFPIGGRVSTAVGVKDKNPVNAAADEPLVLTRCKSEPMRSATAKLAAAPELPCFRKNRKIEPHKPPTRGGC